MGMHATRYISFTNKGWGGGGSEGSRHPQKARLQKIQKFSGRGDSHSTWQPRTMGKHRMRFLS